MKIIEAQTKIQIKNILFATDFSPAANAALPFAFTLARRYAAKVHAVHVSVSDLYLTAPAGALTGLPGEEKAIKERLHELLKDAGEVGCDVIAGTGDVWQVIAAIVAQRGIDLIVIGTRGRTGVGKLLLGSVAEKIFRLATCPVLTVGPHCAAELGGSAEFQRILLATDLSPESMNVAAYAISLAQENQARLTLLHVIERHKTGEFLSPDQLVSSSLRVLDHLVPEAARLWCSPDSVVAVGDPAEKILDIAEQKKADLIVLGVHAARGVPGAATHLPMAVAHKVVSHAHCPVFTARE
jgi:nucleotide-binding universal stress UspA family protein